MVSFVERSNKYTGVGVGASGLGSLASILAFALPYWIYIEEDLTLSDATGSYPVQFTYYYGLWKYCNKVLSDITNSDTCGSVDTHSDEEQTTATLLLLSILLFVSAVVNGSLYLTAFKKERLCLYIAWLSIVIAGLLATTSLITYTQSDHSVTLTNTITLNFSASRLHASFWLVVSGCIMVAIATVFITLAIINARRGDQKADDQKSVISYDSVDKKFAGDSIPDKFEYRNVLLPDPYHHDDSPYTSSCESSTDLDEDECDSDDSDIDPKFAKLKTKVASKSSGVKSTDISDLPEVRRCRSGEPPISVGSAQRSGMSSLFRSRSASNLTPVEHPEDRQDLFEDKRNSKSKNPQPIEVEPVQDDAILYIGSDIDVEPGHAPVATNLIVTLPWKPSAESSEDLILRRAKTEMPFTQRMRNVIGITSTPSDGDSTTTGQHEIKPAATFPFKKKSSKKTRKSKPKKPSEEELRRQKELTNVYATVSSIKTYHPGQHSNKPAPWSKAKGKGGPRKTKTSMKWSLAAYGADFAKLSRQMQLAKKKHAAMDSPEDSDLTDTEHGDSSFV